MPTSRAGSSRARNLAGTGGFTLLEILVTVAIIAIVSALAAPAIAGRLLESPLEHTARVLKGMLEEARADAAVRATPVAVLWSPQSRRFALRGRDREHVLPIPPDVQVTVAGLVRAEGDPGSPDTRDGLVFFPLGGSTGGGVTLSSAGRTMTLRTDPMTGAVALETGR
jgi:type II secretion system protein H